METNSERRVRKLGLLCTEHGGLETIASRAKLSAESLQQVIKGTLLPPKKGDSARSARSLGDSAARAIEQAFELERGWFDNDIEFIDMTSHELLLLGYFRLLDARLQSLVIENVRQAAEKRAALAEALDQALKKPAPVEPPEPKR